ncbi:hypothetical protein CYMTET_55919 [Cymbomonas tetramitiformis]|uniref:Uncharacterized protein n=1 Tax=Cymbomonas tetramitiformis TaxID=36881 RepID=A0AAE0BD63_9CHLO|nr:hypothetical protein CYMTET_55919 [Cymbomonas tetramitiformis]
MSVLKCVLNPLVPDAWWWRGGSIGGGDPAPETQQQCAGRTATEGLRRVAGLLGGVDGMGGTDEDDGGDVGRSAGGVDTRRAPQSLGAHPGSDDHLQQVARQHTASHQLPCPPGEVAGRAGTNITAQVWSALLKFAATSQGNQRKGSSHGELALGVEGYRRKSVADAQVWMRATQFIILVKLEPAEF